MGAGGGPECMYLPYIQSFVALKGGGFYDKLGAEVGTQNSINGALATFIDISG